MTFFFDAVVRLFRIGDDTVGNAVMDVTYDMNGGGNGINETVRVRDVVAASTTKQATTSLLPAAATGTVGAVFVAGAVVCAGEAVARHNAPESALRPSTMLNNFASTVSAFSMKTGFYGGALMHALFRDAFAVFGAACRVLVAPLDVYDGIAEALYDHQLQRDAFADTAKLVVITSAAAYAIFRGVFWALSGVQH